jgi:hypothetical protein
MRCQRCNKKATWNYCTVEKEYKISYCKNGCEHYEDTQNDIAGDQSLFLCDKHREDYINGKL